VREFYLLKLIQNSAVPSLAFRVRNTAGVMAWLSNLSLFLNPRNIRRNPIFLPEAEINNQQSTIKNHRSQITDYKSQITI